WPNSEHIQIRQACMRLVLLPSAHAAAFPMGLLINHPDGEGQRGSGPCWGVGRDGKGCRVQHVPLISVYLFVDRIHTHWDLNISFRETSCSRDNDLSTIISNLHQSRQLVMPETQSRCEFKRNSVDVGLGAAGKRPEPVLLLHPQICAFLATALFCFPVALLFGDLSPALSSRPAVCVKLLQSSSCQQSATSPGLASSEAERPCRERGLICNFINQRLPCFSSCTRLPPGWGCTGGCAVRRAAPAAPPPCWHS
uniref:Uncharacterized protein n=1 Tax=Meleagris gallopavo TaxID=9103 RepID=A0A803YM03_MELGA